MVGPLPPRWLEDAPSKLRKQVVKSSRFLRWFQKEALLLTELARIPWQVQLREGNPKPSNGLCCAMNTRPTQSAADVSLFPACSQSGSAPP